MQQQFPGSASGATADLLRVATIGSRPGDARGQAENPLRALYERDSKPPAWSLNFRIAAANRLGKSEEALELARSADAPHRGMIDADIAIAYWNAGDREQ